MTEKQLAVFGLAKFVFVMAELCMRQAWRRGLFFSPWVIRNMGRFTTLIFLVALFVEPTWRFGNGLCAFFGIILWNWPKDGSGPPRRRREQEKKETERSPNWTGIPEAA